MRIPVATVLVPLVGGGAQFMQQLEPTIIATALPGADVSGRGRCHG